MRKTLIATCLALALPLVSTAQADTSPDPALVAAVANPARSAQFSARDAARKPVEVLSFAGLKPDLTVVEIGPGAGYWTEVLAPYLAKQGTFYTAITPRAASERAATAADNWAKKLESNEATWGKVRISDFGKGVSSVAPAGTADVVLTFRNVHNWMAAGFAEEAFKAFYNALKPGGVLVVEEHRALTDKPQDPKASNGYVREDYTKDLAKQAGFEFVGSSEILANPKDTKNWEKGVWTLPPTLMLGEQDREKYLAIGEADNFLLKFRKPKN
ncbi:MAG: class I SAM-dependent methyltransferase [Sinobacteraceae bacterium]|nr:class I SAM-dependent methyltransferase [Nevskiaceae bacterium]